MNKLFWTRGRLLIVLPLTAVFLLVSTPETVLADNISKANVHWWWNPNTVVGQSLLFRTPDGLKATFTIHSKQLRPDRVMTLWFIVFNSPENCFTSPCTEADVGNPDTAGDFLYGGGNVTTTRKVELGGNLAAGDVSGSGFIEFGADFLALGVIDPMTAEVMLALHSHGPSGSGADLAAQISSFLGGCDVFLGPGGFASGPEDVPDEHGECSTIMRAIHQP